MDDHPVPLGLPSKILWALTEHMGEGYFGPKSEAAICEMIKHRIATTKAQPSRWQEYEDEADADADEIGEGGAPEPLIQAEEPPPSSVSISDTSRGYQWKQLFLPNGTELRTIYCGRSLYARVENELIISDGEATTPSRLANRNGCGTRNAWKTIWLHFPGAKRWELAARRRDH